MTADSMPMNGRRAEAARNDQRILEAARSVFLADADAPVAEVAKRAGVGISALYRRYPSKDELLQRLAIEGMERYVAEAEAALADQDDPWAVFCTFMRRSLAAGAGSLTVRFAGRFTPTKEIRERGRLAQDLTGRVIDRAKAAGVLRPEIEIGDVSLLLEQLQAVQVGDERRNTVLRARYLELILVGLRAPAESPLPGAAPTGGEIGRRYERRAR